MKRVLVVACLVVTFGLASPPAAQSPVRPGFDVVSIKPANPNAAGPDLPPVGGRFTASDIPMTFDRAVRPETALQSASNAPLSTFPPSDSPSLTTALQEQLGLKLESARGSVEILVIDGAALPEAN